MEPTASKATMMTPYTHADTPQTNTLVATSPTWIRPLMAVIALGGVLAAGSHLTSPSDRDNLLFGHAALMSSRWGWWLMLPVSGWICLGFAGALAALSLARGSRTSAAERIGRAGLPLLTAALSAAAVWYVGLTMAKAIPYCWWLIAAAFCGLTLGILLLHAGPSVVAGAGSGPGVFRGWPWLTAGLLLAGTMALLQSVDAAGTPARARHLERVRQAQEHFQAGAGEDRVVVPFNSNVPLFVRRTPLLGSSDTPHLIVFFFDYTSLDSRTSYQVLKDMRERFGDQVAIMPLVYPLHRDCNPKVTEEVGAEQANACDYARLSLAVWRADPDKFPDFHEALMSPADLKILIPLQEARRRAGDLIGEEKLEQALADPWINQELAAHVAAKAPSMTEEEVGEHMDYEPCAMWGGSGDLPGQIFSGLLERDGRILAMFEQSTRAQPVSKRSEDQQQILQLLSR